MTECINLTCGLLIVHGSSRLPSLAWCSSIPSARPPRGLPTQPPLPNLPTRAAPSCTGACLCQQVVLWLLACFGYALPIMAQMLSQTAALQAFVRRCGQCSRSRREVLLCCSACSATLDKLPVRV